MGRGGREGGKEGKRKDKSSGPANKNLRLHPIPNSFTVSVPNDYFMLVRKRKIIFLLMLLT